MCEEGFQQMIDNTKNLNRIGTKGAKGIMARRHVSSVSAQHGPQRMATAAATAAAAATATVSFAATAVATAAARPAVHRKLVFAQGNLNISNRDSA